MHLETLLISASSQIVFLIRNTINEIQETRLSFILSLLRETLNFVIDILIKDKKANWFTDPILSELSILPYQRCHDLASLNSTSLNFPVMNVCL
jgi:hypothetical protein